MAAAITILILALYAVSAAAGILASFPGVLRTQRAKALGVRIGAHAVRVMRVSLFAGFALQTIWLTVWAVRAQNIPIRSLYDTILFCLWLVALVAIFIDRFYRFTPLNAFLLPLLVLLSCGAVFLANRRTSLPPELNSLWLGLHIVPILAGFACFALSSTASLLYITEEQWLKVRPIGTFLTRLGGRNMPPLEALERIAKRATIVGFPLYSLGLALGFVWAKAGGSSLSLWPPDATILAALVTWLLYVALVHVRLAEITHGRRVAYFTVVAFILVLLLFLAGLLLGRFHPPSADRARGAGPYRALAGASNASDCTRTQS